MAHAFEAQTVVEPFTPVVRPNGPAAAALLAGGIGGAALGIFTTAAEVIPAVKTALTWVNPVGPLSGKTGLAVIVWLASWAVLHFGLWRQSDIALGRILLVTYILIAVGIVFTFPPVYTTLAGE